MPRGPRRGKSERAVESGATSLETTIPPKAQQYTDNCHGRLAGVLLALTTTAFTPLLPYLALKKIYIHRELYVHTWTTT